MSFPNKLLAPGEEIYLDSRPNWSLLFWPAVVVLVVLAGCVAVVVLWSGAPADMAWVLVGCGLLALLYFLLRYVAWTTTTFVVTSQRIVYRRGILRRTGREIPIGRVQDVTYHQTIIERLVRAGSLTVESAGRHGQDPFPDISRPAVVQSLINRVVAQSCAVYPVDQALLVPRPEAPPPEIVSQPVTDPTPRTVAAAPGSPRGGSGGPNPPPQPFPAEPYAAEPHQRPPDPSEPVMPYQGSPAPPAPADPSIAQQMRELAELHRYGVITDAEYELKRRELFDRL